MKEEEGGGEAYYRTRALLSWPPMLAESGAKLGSVALVKTIQRHFGKGPMVLLAHVRRDEEEPSCLSRRVASSSSGCCFVIEEELGETRFGSQRFFWPRE